GRLAQPVREAVSGGAVLAGALVLGGEPLHHLDTRLAVPGLGGCRLGGGELGPGDGHRPRPEAAVGRAAVTPERLADAARDLRVALAADERLDDVLPDARLRRLRGGGEARGGVTRGGLHGAPVDDGRG